jgi:MraZ protein
MFIGQFRYSLDSKGRVVIPLDYRKQMGTNVVINKGFEKCITIYTVSGFDDFVKNTVEPLSNFRESDRKIKRFIMGSAFNREIDYQGRITLDKSLIDYAKITKDVVICGAVDCIEIWAADEWENIDRARDDEIVEIGNDIANRLSNGK